MTVTWGSYEFGIYSQADNWGDVAGIYIFAGKNQQGHWVALYIGQANSFAQRIPNHERWDEAARLGATHVHACGVKSATDRGIIEEQLIGMYQPRLNVHHR